MKYLYKLFHKQKTYFLFTMLCCIGSITVTLLWNRELANMINILQNNNGDWSKKILLCIILLLPGALFQSGIVLFSSYTGEYAIHDLRMRMANSVFQQNDMEIVTEHTDEQLSLQINEMEEINQYISEHLFVLFSDVINFFFTLIFLLYQNTLLTILCNIPVIILLIYTTISSKIIYSYTAKEQENLQTMNGISKTVLASFPILRVYNAERLLQEKYNESILSWKKAIVTQESVKARLMSVSGMISCLPLLLLLLIGGTMVINGSFSIGMLYIFINLSGNISGVMANMPGHLANYRRFCGCLDRVWQSMERNRGKET